jgi:hypothetical protein
MRILGPICVLVLYVLLVSFYWTRLAKNDPAYNRRWYLTWVGKGLVFPIVAWFLLNIGHTPVMPGIVKVMPRRNIAPPPTIIYPAGATVSTAPIVIPNKPKYIGVGPVGYVALQTAPAFTAVGSFWGALTLGWFTVAFGRRAEAPRAFVKGSLVWCGLMLPVMGLLLWYNGLGILGFALSLCFLPIVHYSVTLEAEPDPVPRYAVAVAKIKFGKYAEAEQAIIGELEKCENHFEGWLMLAELYARQFDDVGEAERTVLDLCDDPDATLSQKSVALHKLADWQLQFRGDVPSARRSLEEIVKRMPGTHLAWMAQLRLRQLPHTSLEWTEQQAHGKKLKMPALNEDFDDVGEEGKPEADPAEAERVANQLVEKLKKDPNDIVARERLARVFAERLNQAGLGINQLELLMEMPEQPANKMAEWLGLIAVWQMKYLHDREAAQKSLQRLIKEYPHSAQAFAAQRRLKLMEMEMG